MTSSQQASDVLFLFPIGLTAASQSQKLYAIKVVLSSVDHWSMLPGPQSPPFRISRGRFLLDLEWITMTECEHEL